jgi:hypothetical protein
MFYALDKNGVLRMREHREKSVGADSEFAIVRADESYEEVLWIRSCLLQARHYSSRDNALQPP